jgi:tRNA 2-selenouridine synthase
VTSQIKNSHDLSRPGIYSLTPSEAIALLEQPQGAPPALDFRSEGEFSEGTIPGFVSTPILNNQERHQVGLCYKTLGQQAAIALGHELVGPVRAERVAGWLDVIREKSAATQGRPLRVIVACWRGGLRSKTGAQWLLEACPDLCILRVEGGTKALRNTLATEFLDHPPMVILAGMTGSGKTRLLQELEEKTATSSQGLLGVDLEKLANHRGSSFGRPLTSTQPAQVTFENNLAFQWRRARREGRAVLLEDESLMIGQIHLPVGLKEKMRQAPFVHLKASVEDRVTHITREYVLDPVRAGFPPDQLLLVLGESLARLRTRLGGLRTQELEASLREAFSKTQWECMQTPEQVEQVLELHRDWVQGLLNDYYDERYVYAMKRQQRPQIFEGDYQQCLNFLKTASIETKPPFA